MWHCVWRWSAILLVLTAASAWAQQAQEAQPSAASERVIGAVNQVQADARQLSLATDQGQSISVVLDEQGTILRVPPGEKDLKNATRIQLSEIGPGDRVLARGRFADDHRTFHAKALIMMSKAELTRKQEKEREDWQRRGVSGTISALNPATREITITSHGHEGARTIIVEASGDVQFRRYAPDSVRFSDAKPGSFAELHVGDQVRVLGERNAEGTRIKPEQIVSGSFRNIAATVTSINVGAGEIVVRDLDSHKPVTVRVNENSTLKRLPPMIASMLVRRAAGTTARPRSPSGRPVSPGSADHPARPRGDFQDMLERMPSLTLAEVKPGDALIISSTAGSDPSRVTAITIVAGVEPLFASAPQGQGVNMGGMWSFGDIGLPE